MVGQLVAGCLEFSPQDLHFLNSNYQISLEVTVISIICFLMFLNVSILTFRSAPPKKRRFWCNVLAIDFAAILASSKLTKMQLKESSDPCVGDFSIAILGINAPHSV